MLVVHVVTCSVVSFVFVIYFVYIGYIVCYIAIYAIHVSFHYMQSYYKKQLWTCSQSFNVITKVPNTPAWYTIWEGWAVKHLGLVISSDLFWSNHITSISAKALGLLYRQYYNHVEGHVLKQLYISLVRPRLEYSCAHWRTRGTLSRSKNLHVRWHQSTAWDAGYEDLLELVGLPPLEQFIWNYVYYSKLLMASVNSPLGFLLPGKFLTTLKWIPFNCVSHLHELMLFTSLSSLTPFPYGTYFTLNRLLVHILSLSITLDRNVFAIVAT